MEDDDRPVGHLLSRREALVWFGATAAALAGVGSIARPWSTPTVQAATPAVAGVPSCIVRPADVQGPYYVDEELNRSDIRSDPATGKVKVGALLSLTFNVAKVSSSGCTPYNGVIVDIWHCDAVGRYSDVVGPGFNTIGQKFLRGYQVTDANGMAHFTTIYPGWYVGRSVHIHFKLRTQSSATQSSVFTSQLFFREALTNLVFERPAYASRGPRDTLNSQDAFYKAPLLLAVDTATPGYTTTFDIGIQQL